MTDINDALNYDIIYNLMNDGFKVLNGNIKIIIEKLDKLEDRTVTLEKGLEEIYLNTKKEEKPLKNNQTEYIS